jgi:hypothetical protein
MTRIVVADPSRILAISNSMPDAPPPLPKSQPFFKRRYSTMLKLFGVGALILVMLIPLFMIQAS